MNQIPFKKGLEMGLEIGFGKKIAKPRLASELSARISCGFKSLATEVVELAVIVDFEAMPRDPRAQPMPAAEGRLAKMVRWISWRWRDSFLSMFACHILTQSKRRRRGQGSSKTGKCSQETE
jgi:hypothetical protein